MQDLTDWLEKLGMSEYAQRFTENRIDSLSCQTSPIRVSFSAIGERCCVRLAKLDETLAAPPVRAPVSCLQPTLMRSLH
jgi:SAM domain (Sterile alpha motif)